MNRFKQHLANQLRFIERSCQAFDSGDETEAQRIAISARIICHQTSRSVSLLTHLNGANILMLSTANSPLGPGGPCNLASLVFVRTDEGVSYRSFAMLDRANVKRLIPFQEWWGTEIVCLAQGVQMTRKSIVLEVAERDGGAHVDSNLKPDYMKIKSGESLAVTFLPAGGEPVKIPLESHVAMTLRQIGFEFLHSSDLLALQNP